MNVNNYLLALIVLFAIYGLIILIRKILNRDENSDWKYYLKENYRYNNCASVDPDTGSFYYDFSKCSGLPPLPLLR